MAPQNLATVSYLPKKDEDKEVEITEEDLQKIRTIRKRYAKMREEIGSGLLGFDSISHQVSGLKSTLK